MKNLQYKHPNTGEWLDLDRAVIEGFVLEKEKKQKFKNPETGRFVIKKTAIKKGFLRDGTLITDTFSKKILLEKPANLFDKQSYPLDSIRFLVIPKNNLITFFTHALIFPAFLDDVFQQTEENVPLLLRRNLHLIQENDVALELILTVDEINSLENDRYFNSALPISRVVNIHASLNTIKAIKEELKTFPDTYIPSIYFKSTSNANTSNYPLKTSFVDESPSIYSTDSSKKYKGYYNRILGMLSYMKCCSLYYADTEKFSSQYSRSFFSVLSPLNKGFTAHDTAKESFWKKFFIPLRKDQLINTIISDIKEGKEITREWVRGLLLSAPNEIQKIFSETVFRDFKREALNKLNKVEWWDYYVLAAIYNYRKDNSIPQVPLNIAKDINSKFAEIVLAILGFYHGYAKLPKDTPIDLKDDFFRKLAIKHNNIKFKLETNLDKKIIETVYQFCFKEQINIDDYNYLENGQSDNFIDLAAPKGYKTEKKSQFGEDIVTYQNQNNFTLESRRKAIKDKFYRFIPKANENQLNKIESTLEQISKDI